MGRGTGSVAEVTPALEQHDVDGPSDHQLVAAVRRGDDRAFEQLYHRYNRRIQAYVYGMCKDHARAEDITQEIFVSALRRMRETERPIAFKPWIYEIAKNACIDQHRRARRAEEISLQAEDALAPSDYGRLVNSEPAPDAVVAAKQDLDNLCGAFGGLSETHHKILVMRELEGLSYREIGDRLGMSRPAVESTLFRARRRLSEEYDELVSGQRCVRIQGIIATAGRGGLGTRDTRRLARHVAHCQPCRREAVAAGLDAAILRPPLHTRVATKVAALLPFPLLGRRIGRGPDDAAVAAVPSSGWVAHLPAVSDQLGAGWAKAAAAAVLLLAGVGAGVGTVAAPHSGDRAAGKSAAPSSDAGAPAGRRGAVAPAALVVPARSEHGSSTRAARRAAGRTARPGGGTSPGSPPAGAADPAGAPAGGLAPTGLSTPVTHVTNDPAALPPTRRTPALNAPTAVPTAGAPEPAKIVTDAGGAAQGVVHDPAGAVGGVVGSAVDGATNGALPPATDALEGVGAAVGGG